MRNLSLYLIAAFLLFMLLSWLANLWSRLFPAHCAHGVAIRPRQTTTCAECLRIRDAEERATQQKFEEQRRELMFLRMKESENIRQLTYLQQMDPLEFERLVSHAYRTLGWEVKETRASGDRGVDAYMRSDGRTLILQCKRFGTGRVGTPVLRDLLGAIVSEGADGGVLVTTSCFTEEAISWATTVPKSIQLVDGHALLRIIEQTYPIGSPVPEDFVTRRKKLAVVPSRCPWCGAKTKRRKGRRGPFYGCTAFPRCRWTMSALGRGYRLVRDDKDMGGDRSFVPDHWVRP